MRTVGGIWEDVIGPIVVAAVLVGMCWWHQQRFNACVAYAETIRAATPICVAFLPGRGDAPICVAYAETVSAAARGYCRLRTGWG